MHVVLETERLLLRRFTEADAGTLMHLESDPEILRYVGRKPLADLDAYRRHIRPDGPGPWAVLEKASGDFLGGCSLKPASDSPSAVEMGFGAEEIEVGYGLRRMSWGRGYATELVRALVRKAFTEFGAACVVASVSIANLASIRVLEKAGLRRAGAPVHLAGEDEASVKYAVTRDQFDHAPPG
jgi:RimJ/RimL family protein N-acetyltransferase